jgi:hypothetical protein
MADKVAVFPCAKETYFLSDTPQTGSRTVEIGGKQYYADANTVSKVIGAKRSESPLLMSPDQYQRSQKNPKSLANACPLLHPRNTLPQPQPGPANAGPRWRAANGASREATPASDSPQRKEALDFVKANYQMGKLLDGIAKLAQDDPRMRQISAYSSNLNNDDWHAFADAMPTDFCKCYIFNKYLDTIRKYHSVTSKIEPFAGDTMLAKAGEGSVEKGEQGYAAEAAHKMTPRDLALFKALDILSEGRTVISASSHRTREDRFDALVPTGQRR